MQSWIVGCSKGAWLCPSPLAMVHEMSTGGAIAVPPENWIAGREIGKTGDNTGPHDRQSEGDAE